MNKKLILLVMLGIFLISLASAAESQLNSLGTYQQYECLQLRQTCGSCTYVNFTKVSYPNGTVALDEVAAEQVGVSWNYTFCNTSALGTYFVEGFGDIDGTDTIFVYDFKVTKTGFDFGESVLPIAILFASLILAVIFMIFGFKLGSNEKLAPLSFFFIVLSIIFCIYSLHQTWVISSDLLMYDGLSSTAEIIYVTVLWLIVGVAIISAIFFFFGFIKELGRISKAKSYGEGFNPITDTYDY